MPVDIESRVDTLETIFGHFMAQTGSMLIRMERNTEKLQDEMSEFKDEMREFKDEMSEFKDEMSEFKDEMSEFKDEMSEFKNEMGEFKDEMSRFKIDSENERKKEQKEWNKKWGALANKMGTIVEDIIVPAVRPALKKYFNCDPDYLAVNVKKKIGENRAEFDVISISDKNAFIVEVKSSPKVEHVQEIKEKITKFQNLFPEYQKKEPILLFGSIRFSENVIEAASREGIYILAYREWEYMDILNFEKAGQFH